MYLGLDLGTTNVKGAVHTATAVADVTFSPRWSVRFQETYDCERNDMVDASLRLRRKLHCWVLEFGVAYDRGEDNVTWLFSFLPALFADDPRAQLVHTGMFQ